MAKRRRSSWELGQLPAKLPKLFQDSLSNLSDEMLLRILSNVQDSISDLTACQQVSKRLNTLAGDPELWKAAYYQRFVRPCSKAGSSGTSQRGRATNWKRQYKILHNWAKGSCGVSEIPVSSRPATPSLMARLHNGVIYNVDASLGLRAWSYKTEGKLLASMELFKGKTEMETASPRSLAIDTIKTDLSRHRLLLGFDDGSFGVYEFDPVKACFRHCYAHPSTRIGPIAVIASAWPYVMMITDSQTLSLYKFADETDSELAGGVLRAPRLISSLEMSGTIRFPLSLSLRLDGQLVQASVAYSCSVYGKGWSVGVQEMSFTDLGVLPESRNRNAYAFAANTCFYPLASNHSFMLPDKNNLDPGQFPDDLPRTKPTSLSYSHPYLLASHSDNTLMLYLVSSTTEKLSITAGRRLWGHTSAVFEAHVDERGKAVSVSTRGGEVRLWKLDQDHGGCGGGSSVKLLAEKKSNEVVSGTAACRGDGFGLGPTLENKGSMEDVGITRGWVGFDDESVVVLREQRQGTQALIVYDFT